MSWSKKLFNTPIISDVATKIASLKVSSDAKNIAEHFTTFLQAELASSQTLKEEVFKIRHNVYCEELKFEEPTKNGQETDIFDAQSIFALIKHKPSNTYTSCVRLIKSAQPSELLPIEEFCLENITFYDQYSHLHPNNFPRCEIAEISRLAVKSEFRRRKVDNPVGSSHGVNSENTYSKTESQCFPFIPIGLYIAAASLSMDAGIKHCYVMMEPRLARSMTFVGIKFIQLAEPIDYHGLRAPYYINPEIFANNISSGFKSLFIAIEGDLIAQT